MFKKCTKKGKIVGANIKNKYSININNVIQENLMVLVQQSLSLDVREHHYTITVEKAKPN